MSNGYHGYIRVCLYISVLADANFPSSSVAACGPRPIRADGRYKHLLPFLSNLVLHTKMGKKQTNK